MKKLFPLVVLVAGCQTQPCPDLRARLRPLVLQEAAVSATVEEPKASPPDATGRDPFVRPERPVVSVRPSQRRVAMRDYGIEVAKLSGIADGMAQLVDPKGLGWNVKVGDFVGKDEQTEEGVSNWVVERINREGVILSLGAKARAMRVGER